MAAGPVPGLPRHGAVTEKASQRPPRGQRGTVPDEGLPRVTLTAAGSSASAGSERDTCHCPPGFRGSCPPASKGALGTPAGLPHRGAITALPAEQTCPGTASGEQARRRGHPGALGLPARTSEGRDLSGQGAVRVPRSPPRALSAASSRGGAPRSALCRPQTRTAPRGPHRPRARPPCTREQATAAHLPRVPRPPSPHALCSPHGSYIGIGVPG